MHWGTWPCLMRACHRHQALHLSKMCRWTSSKWCRTSKYHRDARMQAPKMVFSVRQEAETWMESRVNMWRDKFQMSQTNYICRRYRSKSWPIHIWWNHKKSRAWQVFSQPEINCLSPKMSSRTWKDKTLPHHQDLICPNLVKEEMSSDKVINIICKSLWPQVSRMTILWK